MGKYITREKIKELLYVTLGAFILAISINIALRPNTIVAGGANGISIILNHLYGIDLAVTLYGINIPLLVVCFIMLGKDVGMKTIYGSMIYPFFVALTRNFPVLTEDQLLAGIYGGIITGIGLGLVFKGNASTGGTAIISQIVNKYLKIPLGTAISLVDGLIIMGAFIAFDVDTVLHSLIALFIIGRVVDLVQVSFDRSKNILIISSDPVGIKEMIYEKMDRGVTTIPVKGGYHEEETDMLMCVIPEKDFHALNAGILAIDSKAFVVTMAASEVMGRGFSLKR